MVVLSQMLAKIIWTNSYFITFPILSSVSMMLTFTGGMKSKLNRAELPWADLPRSKALVLFPRLNVYNNIIGLNAQVGSGLTQSLLA